MHFNDSLHAPVLDTYVVPRMLCETTFAITYTTIASALDIIVIIVSIFNDDNYISYKHDIFL